VVDERERKSQLSRIKPYNRSCQQEEIELCSIWLGKPETPIDILTYFPSYVVVYLSTKTADSVLGAGMTQEEQLMGIIERTFEIVKEDDELRRWGNLRLRLFVEIICHYAFGGFRTPGAAEIPHHVKLIKAAIRANYELNDGLVQSHWAVNDVDYYQKLGFDVQTYALEVFNSLQ